MTMKQAIAPSAVSPRRIGVAEAKSRLSEVLRDTAQAPAIIHNRGRDLAVLLAIEDYERLVGRQAGAGAGSALIDRLDAVKRRHGGGVDDFEPAPMRFQPADPFSRRRAPKR